jgi:hypothetical protein
MIIKFRPHHFLCSLGFQGKGYSPAFIKNYQNIIDTLKDSENPVLLQVVEETDAICVPCPHRRGKRCTSQAKIETLDEAHAKILDLKAGDLYTWAEATEKIKQSFTLEIFEEVCKPCSWKELGLCRQALKKLLEKD